MNNIWKVLVLIISLVPSLQSCNLDSDYWHPGADADKISIATIKAVDEDKKEFYFLLDGDKKLYPGKLSNIGYNYEWEEGQRAFIYFNLLEERVSGYDYNAEIFYIENILTKDVIPLTEETADSIGDNKINITYAWYGGEHLNIQFEYMGTVKPKELHMVNLVLNETDEAVQDDEYIVLEFRHNAYDDYPNERLAGIASFRAPVTEEDINRYKGFKIRTYTIYEGVKYKEVLFNQPETSSFNMQTPKIR